MGSPKVGIVMGSDSDLKIMQDAVAVSCVSKSEAEIDALDIYHATMQGMYDAVAGLDTAAEAVLIDAMPLRNLTVPHQSVVHGDAVSASIAAASPAERAALKLRRAS